MGFLDKAKDFAGKAKAKADKNSDKIPDEVENTYDKISDAAEKVVTGEDAAGPHSSSAQYRFSTGSLNQFDGKPSIGR